MKKKLKIAFVNNYCVPFQLSWIKQLEKEYQVIAIFSDDVDTRKFPSYWKVEKSENIIVLGSERSSKKLLNIFQNSAKKYLEEFNPDIIQINGQWWNKLFFDAYIWGVKNKKYLIAGPIEFSSRMNDFLIKVKNFFIWKIIYKKINLFLANAYVHQDYLKLSLNIDHCVNFTNLDDHDSFILHTQRTFPENRKIRFLYAGAFREGMGLNLTLDAFNDAAQMGLEFELILAGYGPLKEKIKEQIEKNELLKSVTLFWDINSWNEIQEVYKHSDVLVCLAEYSPGGSIISAITSGMGVIGTPHTHSMKRYIQHKANGFMVNNKSEVLRAIKLYCLDKKILSKHSEINKKFSYRYSYDSHLEDFNEIIEDYFQDNFT